MFSSAMSWEHVQMLALIDSVVGGEDGGAAIDYITI
jgi:hypothetical protein